VGRIFDAMKAFFDGDDWKYTPLEDRPTLKLGFSGQDANWSCFAQAREQHEQMVFYSVSPMNVPEERRAAVAEFITRANYGMVIGNFEMDYADGEIRYKTSIDAEGVPLDPQLVRQVVYPNVLTFDRYLKGLLAVAFGAQEPAMALDVIEGGAEA
jgi:hypothetical protein